MGHGSEVYKSPKKILTIQRSKWRRGGNAYHLVQNYGKTSLLNEQGMMCCLGFDALACGIRPTQMLGLRNPLDLVIAHYADVSAEYCAKRVGPNEVGPNELVMAVKQAIKHNDADDLDDATREALIREDLKQLGWDDVVFVD